MSEVDLQRREVGGTVTIRYTDVAPSVYAPVTESAALTHAFDYDIGNNMIYFGRAAMGSSKSAAVWQIRKFVYASTTANANLLDTQWAGGTPSFTNAWTARASISYS